MSEKLQKLQELIRLADDGLTREEFMDYFKVVLDVVKKTNAMTEQEIKSLETKYSYVVNELKMRSSTQIEITKKETMNYLMEELEKIEGKVEKKLAEIKNGEDGKDADEEVVVEKAASKVMNEIKEKLPTLEELENDLPKLGARIRDSLELLQGDERLDVSAIKGLDTIIANLKDMIRNLKTVYVGGGSSSGGHTMMVYDLSSQLNGSTKTFSLPSFWRVISVHSSSFPNAFRPTVDYTIDGSAMTITFTSEIEASTTLAAGQTIIVTYSE